MNVWFLWLPLFLSVKIAKKTTGTELKSEEAKKSGQPRGNQDMRNRWWTEGTDGQDEVHISIRAAPFLNDKYVKKCWRHQHSLDVRSWNVLMPDFIQSERFFSKSINLRVDHISLCSMGQSQRHSISAERGLIYPQWRESPFSSLGLTMCWT